MLKFRVTNSMKARRAAEAQRKALEEKLQLEWAWKPMAAMMNEKSTDLVYWIPPLYRNNIKTAGSRVRRKSLAKRSSLTHSRVPYNQLHSQLQASQRKKRLAKTRHKLHTEVSFEDPSDAASASISSRKLCRRRAKLHQEVSFEDPTDADSAVLDSKGEWQDTKDEDNESGIHDETTDYNADDMSLMNVQSIQEEVAQPSGSVKRRLAEHRRIQRSTIKPKVPPKPDFITKSFEAIDKPKPAPTLIRLLEKVSHIHSHKTKPVKPIKPELKKINRRGSESKSSTKQKVKRPSVKIYRGPPQRLSGKRAKQPGDENDMEGQCVIVSVDHKMPKETLPRPLPPKSLSKTPSFKIPPKTPSFRGPSKNTLPKTPTKTIPKSPSLKGSPKPQLKSQAEKFQEIIKEGHPGKADEAEFRNAQLQMILRLLAQLYEEKVSRQDTEIQNLKMRIQTQDKLMKQMAHVVLELKEEVSKIKMATVTSTAAAPPQTEVPSNVLNIKVGAN